MTGCCPQNGENVERNLAGLRRRLVAVVPLAVAVLAGCSTQGANGTASPASSAVSTTPSSSAPATTATVASSTSPSAAATLGDKTGDVTLDPSGDFCGAFTLDVARLVIPDLPAQPIDHGDGNCTYYTQPDTTTGDSVSFVHPYSDQPEWMAAAKAHNSGSGTITPIPVGDGGFCLEFGNGGFMVGWQRGSTGLELDASGSAVTCDRLTRLAQVLNMSL